MELEPHDDIPFDLLLGEAKGGPVAAEEYDKCFLFLDYDGTLREFEDDPMAATPSEDLNYLFYVLCELREKLRTVIISGRDASFLENYMGHHKALTLVAEHGYQVRRAYESEWATKGNSENNENDIDWRDQVLEQMKKVSGVSGSFVEEKAKSVVWHYRAVSSY